VRIPGFTSTGSKRPEALFGTAAGPDLPTRMTRSSGCRVWDERGREYVDYLMGLGAVALGYAHPEVTRAAQDAAADGVVSGLPPAMELEVAELICGLMPWIEQVRFLKTGAEAVAAAVRISRTATGRELVLGCGYHGWLDWCQAPGARGVPTATTAVFAELPFNDTKATISLIRANAARLAAVVVEPVIAAAPDPEWLGALRVETARAGAILVLDEIKTVGRVAVGGAAERWDIRPDLVVMGKAIANGFPLAVVGGRAEVMESAAHTWISSTLAAETVSLAATRATLGVMQRERVPEHLARIGGRLFDGFRDTAARHPVHLRGVAGLPEMCFLQFADEATSSAVAAGCAARGILLKRTAYNFVSLAHEEAVVEGTLAVLDEVLAGMHG
jgi:glutamate-1-semialdehyde 2,1-aminomutase